MVNFQARIYLPLAIVLVFTLGWLFFYLKDNTVYNFILIGSEFIKLSDKSKIINAQAKYTIEGAGYDGQFYYYLALDPINAHYYMDGLDSSSYRYTRILYPVFARIFSFGRADYIPYLLIVINIISICLGTYFLSHWFLKNNLSPYWSLIYGLYPGLHIALKRDLVEPLAYTLIIMATYTFYSRIRFRQIVSSMLFACALLTKEITILFPLVYGFFLILKKDKNLKNGLFFSPCCAGCRSQLNMGSQGQQAMRCF